jgi:hypothetical protein
VLEHRIVHVTSDIEADRITQTGGHIPASYGRPKEGAIPGGVLGRGDQGEHVALCTHSDRNEIDCVTRSLIIVRSGVKLAVALKVLIARADGRDSEHVGAGIRDALYVTHCRRR